MWAHRFKMNDKLDRRNFCRSLALGAAVLATGVKARSTPPQDNRGKILTVRGPISSSDLGITLPHEHVMVDFIGADETGPERYAAADVKQTMAPYLEAIVKQGITGFIDCTPNYLARDPMILRDLSEKTGLHILTNTGLYKEPFLPAYAFSQSSDELAEMWTDEILYGIADTGVQAGFIKIAVFPEPLKPIQQKIVRAAARTHNLTGATIACHTANGPAALEILDILKREGASASAYIFVHAGDEPDTKFHVQVAKTGAWVEFDDIGAKPIEHHLKLIRNMLDQGLEDHLLLSQDRGWYAVGEPQGGEIKPFNFFFDEFVPAMVENGIEQDTIDKLTRTNPARAFQLDL